MQFILCPSVSLLLINFLVTFCLVQYVPTSFTHDFATYTYLCYILSFITTLFTFLPFFLFFVFFFEIAVAIVIYRLHCLPYIYTVWFDQTKQELTISHLIISGWRITVRSPRGLEAVPILKSSEKIKIILLKININVWKILRSFIFV